jgi:hypothetical protein
MADLSSDSVCTRPVGFDGELIHAKSDSGQDCASISTATGSAPAIIAPTLYVGYATLGISTFRDCKKVGNQATNSLDPINGNTSKSPVTPSRLVAHFLIASRSCGVPAVNG